MNPTIYEVHIDAALSNLSVKFTNDEFIQDEICPRLPVKKKSDLYYIYGKEDFKVKDDIRTPGTPAQEIFHTYKTDTYSCEAHSVKEKVPDEVKDNADDPLDPELDATELVTNTILLNREKRVASLLTTGGNYAAGMTTSPTSPWSSSGSTPIKDLLEVGAKAVHKKIFKKPNTLVIPYEVALTLSWHADIKEVVKFTHPDMLLVADGVIIPKTLWGMKVLMPGAGENTAALGQDEALGYIWGKNVVICYVNPAPGLRKVSFAQTFQWKTREVSKWYSQDIKSTWIQCEEWSTEKMICNVAGFLLTNVIA